MCIRARNFGRKRICRAQNGKNNSLFHKVEERKVCLDFRNKKIAPLNFSIKKC